MSKCWMGLILFNFAEPSLTSFCHNWNILMPYLRSYGHCPSLFIHYPVMRLTCILPLFPPSGHKWRHTRMHVMS